ncbi:MAG: GAF domain-containing protein, partial [Chloroflexi bacterium]|nr:GAF domain-containing protein [Chloroflexota bacterium]
MTHPRAKPGRRTPQRRRHPSPEPVEGASHDAQLSALRDIARALGSAWDLETSLQAISQTTASLMAMASCSLYLLDPSRKTLILKASTGLAAAAVGQARLELGEGITGYAAQHGQPVAVRDAASDPRFKYLPQTQEQKFKSLLAVPLISQGRVIGAMNVQTTAFHRFREPEIALLALIGELAAGALERALQHDRLQQQVQELSTLAQVSKAVTAPIYLDEMLSVVVEMAAQIMRARACALLLVDKDSGELVIRAAHGLGKAHARTALQVHNSLTGKVVLSGEPLIVPDL